MHKLIVGEDFAISEGALQQMRERGGKWAAYQNHDMCSASLGHVRFLQVGPDCTFKEAPDRHPDMPGPNGVIGWRYLHVGFVDLDKACIVEKIPA